MDFTCAKISQIILLRSSRMKKSRTRSIGASAYQISGENKQNPPLCFKHRYNILLYINENAQCVVKLKTHEKIHQFG